MKTKDILKLLNRIEKKPKSTPFIAISTALGGISLIAILTLWISLSAIDLNAPQKIAMASSSFFSKKFDQFSKDINTLSRFNLKACLVEIESLIGIQPWIEREPTQNLLQLRETCLKYESESCADETCSTFENQTTQIME